jgi:hypothetical protein
MLKKPRLTIKLAKQIALTRLHFSKIKKHAKKDTGIILIGIKDNQERRMFLCS